MSKTYVALALAGLMGSFAVMAADDNAAKDKDAAAKGKDTTVKSESHAIHNPDHMFASCVAVGNQEELIIAELGRQKATDPKVKEFAEKMIADHHNFLVKLKKFAPEASMPGYLDANVKEASTKKGVIQKVAAAVAGDDKPKVDNAAATSASDDASKGLTFSQLERELANQCLADINAKLNEKSGVEFDQCFMALQGMMHAGMRSKLTVFTRHAGSELKEVLADGLKTTEKHLAEAEKIMKHLDSPNEKKLERKAAREEKREDKAEDKDKE